MSNEMASLICNCSHLMCECTDWLSACCEGEKGGFVLGGVPGGPADSPVDSAGVYVLQIVSFSLPTTLCGSLWSAVVLFLHHTRSWPECSQWWQHRTSSATNALSSRVAWDCRSRRGHHHWKYYWGSLTTCEGIHVLFCSSGVEIKEAKRHVEDGISSYSFITLLDHGGHRMLAHVPSK